jgi:polysaccharide export outer membrane protein
MLGALALSGCAALPASGPTESQVLNDVKAPQNPLGIRIVPIDANTIQALDETPAGPLAAFGTGISPEDSDGQIGIGDMLSISIFEAGNSLFAPAAPPLSQTQTAGPSGAVSNINLPLEQVDVDGNVNVPYAGRIPADGATPDELARRIEAALAGQSQHPQVIVTIAKNIADTVIVSGAVRASGRFPLSLAHEQLLDMVAIAGGPTHGDQDTDVALTRDGRTAREPLSALENDPADNIYLQPGDRIELTYNPRSFTVFGAAEHVQEIAFAAPKLSLADALARAGGPSNFQADPNGVFLFRFESPAVAARLGIPSHGARVPVIFQLDMMQPASYFVAQEFNMHNQDLLYIANAKTDKIGKLFGLIAALVSPASTANYISQ